MTAHIARKLRRRPTDAEIKLWLRLRNRQLEGVKFRRQMPKGPYFVDFAAPEKRLIIEIDGGQHAALTEYENARSRVLAAEGYRVLRFWNNEVLKNMAGVLERIRLNLLGLE